MIYIFHGDNASLSYNGARQLIERLKAAAPAAEVLRLSGTSLTRSELTEAVESPSFFSQERLVEIDNLLTRRPSKEKDALLNYFAKSQKNVGYNIILSEGKSITSSVLKKLGSQNIEVQEFKLSKTIWKFLDALKPKNTRFLLQLFEATVATEPVELAMFWMVRRMGELFLARSTLPHALDSVRTDWQRGNLTRQASMWTEKQLIEFHRRLMEIDEMVKTGRTPTNLRTHLDILLSSL